MSNGQDPIPVILPRQTVENFAAERRHETDADFTRDEHALCQASKQALSHPSVTVEETIFLSAFGDVPLVRMEIGLPDEFLPLPGPHSRPCTVTITPKGGQSGE